MNHPKNILLIISGGIAAYKALELLRLLRRAGHTVRCILTDGGAKFITPLSVASLSEQPVYTDLWSLKDETEMGHIRLSREADLIVAAPASASLIARAAQGLGTDLAATVLLATDKPVIMAPAMNPEMWNNPATQDNLRLLARRDIRLIGPMAGEMACGETGLGRLAEPADILAAIETFFDDGQRLKGLKALVTSGPTFEPIDPVRFIGNRSSGRQGHAIAEALRDMGAAVTLVTGPVSLSDPAGVKTIHVETAAQMMAGCQAALPADIAICAAAVSDWAPTAPHARKIKKKKGEAPPALALTETPDILAALAKAGPQRPHIVIGFAAETDNLMENARAKLASKGCDILVANNVAATETVFGSAENRVVIVTSSGADEWPVLPKQEVARRLARLIEERIRNHEPHSRRPKNSKQTSG